MSRVKFDGTNDFCGLTLDWQAEIDTEYSGEPTVWDLRVYVAGKEIDADEIGFERLVRYPVPGMKFKSFRLWLEEVALEQFRKEEAA